MSGSVKRKFPNLRALVKRIEQEIIRGPLFADLPEPVALQYRYYAWSTTQSTDSIEQQIVKYADMMEAWLFASTECQIGNSLMEDIREETLRDIKTLQWDWLKQLRQHVPELP